MFPIKVKKTLNEVEDSAKNTRVLIRNGIIAIIILAIFVTPYVVNFEFYVEEDSPGGNLDEFLDVTKGNSESVSGANMPAVNTGTVGSPVNGSQSGTAEETSSSGFNGAVDGSDGDSLVIKTNDAGATHDTVPSGEGDASSSEQTIRAEAGESRLHEKEQKAVRDKNEVVSMKILGTKIDQKLGKQSPGKSCVVFYAEDPDVVKDVVSTKICPDERDRHIEFHMKGIFSSHPHAPGEADSEPVRVRYVHTGPLVWTTFFQQHNDQHQTLVVPPGITTDVKYLTSGQEDVFHQEFDSVRVLHTAIPAGKTRGLQATFPTCAQFYESVNVGVKAKGFMVCQGNPKIKRADYTLDKLSEYYVNPQNTDTNGITYVVAGAEVGIWAYFGKNLDGDMLAIPKGTTADLNTIKRVKEDKDGPKELTWNKKIKSFKLKFG